MKEVKVDENQSCSGCMNLTIHHTCGKSPAANQPPQSNVSSGKVSDVEFGEPERIWLHGKDEPFSFSQPTYMTVRLDPRNVEYVRHDLYDSLREHNRQLSEALESMVCQGCGNRIGWNETPSTKYRDWTTCSSCKAARAALKSAKEMG